MDQTALFETERPRLVHMASRVLGDRAEAEDMVQQTWLRLHQTDADIDNLPGWLWRHPIASMGWYRDAKKAFVQLPED